MVIKSKKYLKVTELVFKKIIDKLLISNVKCVDIEYIGEMIFNSEDIIESSLIFKKTNSQYVSLRLLIPAVVNDDMFKINNKNDKNNIEIFLNDYLKSISNEIISIYNMENSRHYLVQYQCKSLGVTNNIVKKDIYRISFELNGKKEFNYIDFDKSQL